MWKLNGMVEGKKYTLIKRVLMLMRWIKMSLFIIIDAYKNLIHEKKKGILESDKNQCIKAQIRISSKKDEKK